MRRTVRRLAGGMAAGSLVFLAACGSVSGSSLAPDVAHAIAQAAHIATPKVTCPHDLRAKTGATTECDMTPQSSSAQYSVDLQVVSVTGNKVNFKITSITCTSDCSGSTVSGASGATGATGTGASGISPGGTGSGTTGSGATGTGATGTGTTGSTTSST